MEIDYGDTRGDYNAYTRSDFESSTVTVQGEVKEMREGDTASVVMDAEHLERAADGVIQGIAWNETEEGREYWQLVYKKLMAIAHIHGQKTAPNKKQKGRALDLQLAKVGRKNAVESMAKDS